MHRVEGHRVSIRVSPLRIEDETPTFHDSAPSRLRRFRTRTGAGRASKNRLTWVRPREVRFLSIGG